MILRFRRFEIRTVEPRIILARDKEEAQRLLAEQEQADTFRLTPGHVKVAADMAMQLYATKKTIDFIFHAAEHVLVTKIR